MKYVIMVSMLVCGGLVDATHKTLLYCLSAKLQSQPQGCYDSVLIISLYADPLACHTQYLWHCFFLNMQSAQKIIDCIRNKIELQSMYYGDRNRFERQLVNFFSFPAKKMSWLSEKQMHLIVKHNRSLLMNMARSSLLYDDTYTLPACTIGSFLAQSYLVFIYLDEGNCKVSDVILKEVSLKLLHKLQKKKYQKQAVKYYVPSDSDLESQTNIQLCSMQ